MTDKSNNNEVFITPNYMAEFKCIGEKCKDSCCTGFNIDIDQNTFNKYISSTDKKINSISKQYIKKNKNNSNLSFAQIERKNNACAFLSDKKLCNAYSFLGKEHLSVGCSTYPRVIKKFSGTNFIAGELSCPEVSRLCLKNPNINIKKLKINDLKNIFNSNKVFKLDIKENLPEQINNFIDIVFSNLLNKDTVFNNLLEIILSFYKIHNKTSFLQENKFSIFEKEKLKENNLLIQSQFLPKICFKKNIDITLRYHIICAKAAENTKYFVFTDEEFKTKYYECYKNKFDKFIIKNKYILKNFFLNEFIKNIDTLISSTDTFDNFIREVLYKISISSFLTTCLAFNDNNPITNDDYIEVLSAIQKLTQNSQEKNILVTNFFKKIDKNNLFLRLFDIY